MEIKIKVKEGYEPEDILEKALTTMKQERVKGKLDDPYLNELHEYSMKLYDLVMDAMIEEILEVVEGEELKKSSRPKKIRVKMPREEVLEKSARPGLVKVLTTINGKNGQYEAYRWKRAAEAKSIVEKQLINKFKVTDIKDLSIIKTSNNKEKTLDQVIKEYEKSNAHIGLDKFIVKYYKIKRKTFDNKRKTGYNISTGATIVKPDDDRARTHAEMQYEAIRHQKTDVKRIAKNTGFSEEVIQKIKNYLFIDEHDLGEEGIKRFKPDFAIAQSWGRLAQNNVNQFNKIEPHDLTLIKHEAYEMELVSKGLSQSEAHDIVNEKYNYGVEVRKYYDNLEKRKKRK